MSETPQFEERLVYTTAAMRITGSKQEIDPVINALARAGFLPDQQNALPVSR